jgi:hypothetical protein
MLAESFSIFGFDALVEHFGCGFQGVIFHAFTRRKINRKNAFTLQKMINSELLRYKMLEAVDQCDIPLAVMT